MKAKPRCGTDAGYTWGCRCDECRAAHTEYHRAYRQRMKQMIQKTCPNCAKVYNTTRAARIYCTIACQKAATKAIEVAERRAALTDQTCPVCSVVFRISGETGSSRVYCSKKCKTRARAWSVKYGLEPDQFRVLMESQDGRCAICQVGIEVFMSHVDHNHVTGAVRGLLCMACNVGLGHFRDDRVLIQAADAYLARTDGTVTPSLN